MRIKRETNEKQKLQISEDQRLNIKGQKQIRLRIKAKDHINKMGISLLTYPFLLCIYTLLYLYIEIYLLLLYLIHEVKNHLQYANNPMTAFYALCMTFSN